MEGIERSWPKKMGKEKNLLTGRRPVGIASALPKSFDRLNTQEVGEMRRLIQTNSLC